MTAGCVHGCDPDGWIGTDTGLMPCPRHRLDEHQRWADGHHRPTGGTIGATPPTEQHKTIGRAGIAAARAAIEATTDPERNT